MGEPLGQEERSRPPSVPGREGPPSVGQGQAGGKEVLAVALAAVAVVLAAALVTSLLPPLHEIVLRTPIAIAVLVVGTCLVLWRLTRDDG